MQKKELVYKILAKKNYALALTDGTPLFELSPSDLANYTEYVIRNEE